ncbi:class I lanthipeptide [Christiangramia sp. LLG6405-1]|uniref:class I lanthipeptide n=1 Tax=Christiangramia sp. LLG6405-1 TaxID=3160832 RepID=UPI0038695AE6
MRKLQLNKKTVSALNRVEMQEVNGGVCVVSCQRGSDRGKECCESGRVDLSLSGVGNGECGTSTN